MRIMGLDVGGERLGVAVSDELEITAQPLLVIPAGDEEFLMDRLAGIAREYRVKEVVVGLPLNLDGSRGAMAEKALEFVSRLEERLGLPVVTWDERFSSRAVERTLIEADVSRSGRKKVIDKLAAAYMLQGYLDHRSMAQDI